MRFNESWLVGAEELTSAPITPLVVFAIVAATIPVFLARIHAFLASFGLLLGMRFNESWLVGAEELTSAPITPLVVFTVVAATIPVFLARIHALLASFGLLLGMRFNESWLVGAEELTSAPITPLVVFAI